MSAPPCHFLPSLETALPLCGEAAVLATYCTMNPLLVTCPRCRRASIHVDYPLGAMRRHQEGTHPPPPLSEVSAGNDRGNAAAARLKSEWSEGRLLREVRQLAQNAGYLTYHTYRSDRSEKGWFDLACAKPGHPLILAELKTQRGKLTMAQRRWVDAVTQATGVETHVWRPADLSAIVTLFRR